jgi:hypothetical protein
LAEFHLHPPDSTARLVEFRLQLGTSGVRPVEFRLQLGTSVTRPDEFRLQLGVPVAHLGELLQLLLDLLLPEGDFFRPSLSKLLDDRVHGRALLLPRQLVVVRGARL